jgi:predicted GNAT superfamily acetyltransferase
MTITYQAELIRDVAPDVDELLKMHYEELTLNKDRVKLAPDWMRYVSMENAGALRIFTARENGELIGYSAFFVQAHIHYEGTIVACNDVLFLRPDKRLGLTGVKLIKFSESELQRAGVNKITWHAKHNTPLIPLLERFGYRNEEVVMGKHF